MDKPVIRTGYFAKYSLYENPVSIARKTPSYAKVPCYIDLAPEWSLIKAYSVNKDRDEYTEKYFSTVLGKLNPEKVIQDLRRFGNIVTLLCYEKPEDFCHRHLVAKWLQDSLGIHVKEA